MNDEQIIELYYARDEAAIRETDACYGTKLGALAQKILNSFQDAEEIRSDTYLKAWNSIPPARPIPLYGWLAMVCRSLSINRLNWQQAKKRNAAVVTLSGELADILPDPRAEDAMNALSAKELGELINSFLRKEPPEKRRIFLRRYWYLDSIQEISMRYGFGAEKVKTDLFRMRKRLKAMLEKEGYRI